MKKGTDMVWLKQVKTALILCRKTKLEFIKSCSKILYKSIDRDISEF